MLGRRGNRAAAQNLVDSGQAATLEEAVKLAGSRAIAGRAAANAFGSTGVGMQTGIGNAIKRGLYTKYPGVRWRKDSQKWHGAVRVRGQSDQHGLTPRSSRPPSRTTRHDLKRPVHFARAGELLSSQCAASPVADQHFPIERRAGDLLVLITAFGSFSSYLPPVL